MHLPVYKIGYLYGPIGLTGILKANEPFIHSKHSYKNEPCSTL